MRGNKTLKRIITVVLVVAIVAGLGAGGYVLIKNRGSGKEVKVYSVADFSTDYSWGDSNESYGMITTENIQSVYVSDTQKVTEIYVTEGQQVLEGDPLMSYDTTLSDIELQRASIQLQKLKIQLDEAKKELAKINTYKPYVPVVPTPVPSVTPTELIGVTTPYLVGGSGTIDDPLVYIWNSTDEYTQSFVDRMLLDKANAGHPVTPSPTVPVESDPVVTAPPATDPVQPSESPVVPTAGLGEVDDDPEPSGAPLPTDNIIYATFVVREGNSLNGKVQDYWGIKFTKRGSGFTFRLVDAVLPKDPSDEPDDPGTDDPGYTGPQYTAAEIAQMKLEKTREIRDLDLSIRKSQVEYDRMEKEVNDGMVRSTISGTVKSVLSAEDAKANGKPVIQVSGGGGYYVEGAVGELMLGTIVPGQTVTINSWESGGTYDGQVVEVSDYPVSDANAWSEGNSNVSYYPFKVFINEDADLREGEYVSIMYSSSGSMANFEPKLYLQTMFILTDGGKSYVYVRNDENLLEKREIATGRNLWGSYLEVKSGLTREDWIAFPYGKEVKDGAKTDEGSYQDLYGSYY